MHATARGLPGERSARRPDWTIDQEWGRYTAQDHAVWRALFERQSRLLPGRACDAFVEGMARLPLGADAIPDLRALSEVLMAQTGWQVVAVPGLVPDEVFLEHLAHRPAARESTHRTPCLSCLVLLQGATRFAPSLPFGLKSFNPDTRGHFYFGQAGDISTLG